MEASLPIKCELAFDIREAQSLPSTALRYSKPGLEQRGYAGS